MVNGNRSSPGDPKGQKAVIFMSKMEQYEYDRKLYKGIIPNIDAKEK